MGPTDFHGIGNDDGNNDDDGGGQVWDWEAELPPEDDDNDDGDEENHDDHDDEYGEQPFFATKH